MVRLRRDGRARHRAGFTLLELLFAMAITGILATLGITSYRSYLERVDVAEAVVDIRAMQNELKTYEAVNAEMPDTLLQADIFPGLDPWGNNYVYLKLIQPPDPGANLGSARKDQFAVPVNTDFDLYSPGKDGVTARPLNAANALDDVVRASDGSFIGLAERY